MKPAGLRAEGHLGQKVESVCPFLPPNAPERFKVRQNSCPHGQLLVVAARTLLGRRDLNRKPREVELADREHEACLVALLGLKCYSHISRLCTVFLLRPLRITSLECFPV